MADIKCPVCGSDTVQTGNRLDCKRSISCGWPGAEVQMLGYGAMPWRLQIAAQIVAAGYAAPQEVQVCKLDKALLVADALIAEHLSSATKGEYSEPMELTGRTISGVGRIEFTNGAAIEVHEYGIRVEPNWNATPSTAEGERA